jgi:hypothetical protein
LRRKQIGVWRRRWKQSFDALVAIECRESQLARGAWTNDRTDDWSDADGGGFLSAYPTNGCN